MFKVERIACVLLALCALAGEAHAQKLQWTDVVYVSGRWQAGKIVPPAGKDSLAFVMRIDYFAQAPRWRAEIRRTANGATFGDPLTLMGDKQAALVVTPLGTTPLDQHVIGRDSLVRAAVVFDASGKRTGPASGQFVDRKANGTPLRVAYRRTVAVPGFADDDLNPRSKSAARQIISSNLASVGDQRSAAVVATAGARGVDKVKTPKGEIAVQPDPIAVLRMERFAINAIMLEEFLRAGGLGPYKPGAP